MECFVEGKQVPAEEQTSVEQLVRVQQKEEEWCFGMVGQCFQRSRRARLGKLDIRSAQFDA